METLSVLDWSLAFVAAFFIGISKSGIKGIAIIPVVLMALVFSSKASTGIILPLLIVGDIFAIIYYRKHLLKKHLIKLLPWMLLGVLAGVYVGKDIPEGLFKIGMSAIILISVCSMFWWDYKKIKNVPKHPVFGMSMGLSAGFATMIGNLAGAFSNLYFLAMQLPKNQFIGTASWLFFVINWFKIPFHVYSWKTITPATLKINLVLVLVEFIGLFVGVKLVEKISEKSYRKLVLFLTAVGAIFLFIK